MAAPIAVTTIMATKLSAVVDPATAASTTTGFPTSLWLHPRQSPPGPAPAQQRPADKGHTTQDAEVTGEGHTVTRAGRDIRPTP